MIKGFFNSSILLLLEINEKGVAGVTYPETQNEKPEIEIPLERVGIQGLKTILTVHRNGKWYRFIPTVTLTIDLPEQFRGVHMSRLVESITECIAQEIKEHEHASLEEISIHVLKELQKRHNYKKGLLKMELEFAMERKTPVSKKVSVEVYPVTLITEITPDHVIHEISIKARGNTACPHAYAVAEGRRTHVQRAVSTISVVGETTEMPLFEELIDILEESFSSPTFSLLKTPDEEWVVRQMFENPRFCEDVTRTILRIAMERLEDKRLNILAETISEESIHKHDVVARGHLRKKPELPLRLDC